MEEKIDKAIETVRARLLALNDHSDMQKAGQAVLNLAVARECYVALIEPDEQFDEEISFVLSRIRSNSSATDMQHATQAVLNLMQAKARLPRTRSESELQQVKASKKQTAGV